MNYSYKTSHPAYQDNQNLKQIQAERILGLIRRHPLINTLKQLAELTGLPQSTVSGRVNDLLKDGKVNYSGTVSYKNRLRKRIVAVSRVGQGELFKS